MTNDRNDILDKKLREAYEKWEESANWRNYAGGSQNDVAEDAFEAGYKAARTTPNNAELVADKAEDIKSTIDKLYTITETNLFDLRDITTVNDAVDYLLEYKTALSPQGNTPQLAPGLITHAKADQMALNKEITERVLELSNTPQGNWQDISTAPKDGSSFLLSNGYWTMEHKWNGKGFWCNRYNNYSANTNCKYWQPLPAAPQGNKINNNGDE